MQKPSNLVQNSLFGIPPSGKLAFLRFGEFHRLEDGKIIESHVYLGFAELIIALGLWPLAPSQGYEGVVPGPATHDGIVTDFSDPERSRTSAERGRRRPAAPSKDSAVRTAAMGSTGWMPLKSAADPPAASSAA